jgi:hypothetical protein
VAASYSTSKPQTNPVYNLRLAKRSQITAGALTKVP